MDPIIEEVGSFGTFQYRIVFIVGLVSMLASASIYSTIFIAAEPKLICRRINLENQTNLNENIPSSYKENCDIWSSILENNTNKQNFHHGKKLNDKECYFDRTYYERTVVNEWNLVCSRQFRVGLFETLHILGSLFGCFGAFLGDLYGRRISVIVFAFMFAFNLSISQILMLDILNLDVETKYIIFAISQFFIGLLVNCLYSTAYVLLMEITTEQYRTSLANLNSYIYVLGELMVLLVYYFWRDWTILNWFLVLYSSVLCLLLVLFMPESPVWLICMNRSEEAHSILKIIAKTNGLSNYSMPTKEIAIIEKNSQLNSNSDFKVVKHLLYPLENLMKASILLYIWSALMLIYYGISLGVLNVDFVNPYLMYLLSVIAEVIGYSMCYLNDFFGPKKMITVFFLNTSIIYSLIAFMNVNESSTFSEETSFSTKGIILMVLGLIGKSMISGIYNLAYIYTAELYPVNLRNAAVHILTSLGGVASLTSPQINMLKKLVWYPLPNIVYSAVAIVGACVVWFLPDTRTLPKISVKLKTHEIHNY